MNTNLGLLASSSVIVKPFPGHPRMLAWVKTGKMDAEMGLGGETKESFNFQEEERERRKKLVKRKRSA